MSPRRQNFRSAHHWRFQDLWIKVRIFWELEWVEAVSEMGEIWKGEEGEEVWRYEGGLQ